MAVSNYGENYNVVVEDINHCLKKGVSVLLTGHPGCGKSAMAAELAQRMGLPMVDIRLSQMDPIEFCGAQMPNRETGRMEWFEPFWFPKVPSFIFLDEINAAISKTHQSVAYQLVLDKKIGPHKLPEGCVVMAAGNLPEDGALVVELSSALNNRFVHFTLRPDVDSWLKWAEENGISTDMRAYIAFRRIAGLYDNTGEAAFPTPRSIVAADRINGIKNEGTKRRLFAGCIGVTHTAEFFKFLKIYKNIDIKGIIEDGKMPELKGAEESFLCALVYSVADYIKNLTPKTIEKNAENIIAFSNHIQERPEFEIVFLKSLSPKASFWAAIKDKPGFEVMASRVSAVVTEAIGE